MQKQFITMGILLIGLAAGGCQKHTPPTPMPEVVKVVEVVQQDYPWQMEYPAQAAGSLDVQIRAQVGGILQARLYNEGEFVAAGQQLFQIDDKEYKVALAKARGNLSQAKAEVVRTRRAYARMKRLRAENAVSQQEYDNALSAYETAKADEQVAEAGVSDAEINLGYTKVTAPISGIAGPELQTVGSLISVEGDSGLLTTMVQIDPLYVNFSMPGSQFEQLTQGYRDGTITMGNPENPAMLKSPHYRAAGADQVPIYVEVVLSNGRIYPQRGKLIFFDSSENTQTSSIAIKAEVPNPARTRELIPGQFVRVRLVGAVFKNAVLVPSSAVLSSASGLVAYVVGADNKLEARPIQAHLQDDMYRVLAGLKAGEKVVNGGLSRLRPGMTVTAQPEPFTVTVSSGTVQQAGSADRDLAALENVLQQAQVSNEQALPAVSSGPAAGAARK